jgi:hypothetical protein
MDFCFHQEFGFFLGFWDFVIFPFPFFLFQKERNRWFPIPWGKYPSLIERKQLLDLTIPNPFHEVFGIVSF